MTQVTVLKIRFFQISIFLSLDTESVSVNPHIFIKCLCVLGISLQCQGYRW